MPSDERYARAMLQHIQGLRPQDVREVVILMNNCNIIVRLRGETDGAEIERILNVVKRIQVTSRLARVDPHRDQLRIITRDEHQKWAVSGCFDPSRAPIISPSMRSDDLSRIVQDIVRRKGKPIRTNRQ